MSTISIIAGTEGTVIGWNLVYILSARASAFLESARSIPPRWQRVDGVGILITPLVTLHSDWSSGSSVALHWSLLQSLSWRVTDLCRRLTTAPRPLSLVTCHCLRSLLAFRLSHPECQPVSEAVCRHAGDSLEWKLLELSERRRSSQRTRPLPSRYAFPGWTEFLLPGGSGILSSQCARSQGDPVGTKWMTDTHCRWLPEDGPSSVPRTKSGAAGRKVSWLSPCPRHRE